MKKSFLVIFLALVVLATVHTSFAASVSPGSGHGPVINRGGVHDYESSAIRYHSGNLRVWSCTNHEGHDAIYMTVFNTDHPTSVNNTDYPWPPSLSSWPALLPSPGYFDEKHACSPAVVNWPENGTEYRMYYECSTGSRADICFAKSSDFGASWAKVGRIIQSPGGGSYGMGHTSAVLNPNDPTQTFLYYYDGTCWDGPPCPVMRRRILGSDGVCILDDRKTDGGLSFPVKVKYYHPDSTGGKGAFYLATSLVSDPAWVAIWTSTDGLRFTQAGGVLIPGDPDARICGLDPGQLIADGNGWIRTPTSDLQVLIGAGKIAANDVYATSDPTVARNAWWCGIPSEPTRGSTWAVYIKRFSITLP